MSRTGGDHCQSASRAKPGASSSQSGRRAHVRPDTAQSRMGPPNSAPSRTASSTVISPVYTRLSSSRVTPVTTRSETFGWKFGHVGPDERSGFTRPPCQPLEPRSARRMTTTRAAAWSAGLSLICSLPSPAVTRGAVARAPVKSTNTSLMHQPTSKPLPFSCRTRPPRVGAMFDDLGFYAPVICKTSPCRKVTVR